MAKKEETLMILVSKEFKDKVIEQANKCGLSLSAYVRLVLSEKLLNSS